MNKTEYALFLGELRKELKRVQRKIANIIIEGDTENDINEFIKECQCALLLAKENELQSCIDNCICIIEGDDNEYFCD